MRLHPTENDKHYDVCKAAVKGLGEGKVPIEFKEEYAVCKHVANSCLQRWFNELHKGGKGKDLEECWDVLGRRAGETC